MLTTKKSLKKTTLVTKSPKSTAAANLAVHKKPDTAKNKAPPKIRKIAHTWQLQEAKARFSEVIKAAENKGPQRVTLRGEPKAVVISEKEYEKLTKPKLSLYDFIRNSPLYGTDFPIERDKSTEMRDIAL